MSKEAFLRMRGAVRWVGISVAGLVLIVAGIVMLFTPGPGIAAILAGLAIWARQFHWARRRLEGIIDGMSLRREKLPAFAGRFLDERLRRRAIREHAEAVAKGENPGPLELTIPGVEDNRTATTSPAEAAPAAPATDAVTEPADEAAPAADDHRQDQPEGTPDDRPPAVVDDDELVDAREREIDVA